MSPVLIAASVLAAALLALAVVKAFRSFEECSDRVAESTRIRIIARYPLNVPSSGVMYPSPKGGGSADTSVP